MRISSKSNKADVASPERERSGVVAAHWQTTTWKLRPSQLVEEELANTIPLWFNSSTNCTLYLEDLRSKKISAYNWAQTIPLFIVPVWTRGIPRISCRKKAMEVWYADIPLSKRERAISGTNTSC
jgi:hypothetical protein